MNTIGKSLFEISVENTSRKSTAVSLIVQIDGGIWTCESADNVLQIRATIASNEWLPSWEAAVERSIQKAA